MQFYIPMNDKDEEGCTSVTYQVLDTGSDCPRTNKKQLMQYLRMWGVREFELKKVMKALGFWGAGLSPQDSKRTVEAAQKMMRAMAEGQANV